MYLELEVPLKLNYNYIMEIKDKKGEWVKIEKGDIVGDGYEEGSVVNILVDGNEIELGVYDGKEGWSMSLKEVREVNGDRVELA
jgi:hypothetical protein